jgi:hypothetical protein
MLNFWWFLAAVLAVLKLCGVADISWWVVLAPIFFQWLCLCLGFLFLGLLEFVCMKMRGEI